MPANRRNPGVHHTARQSRDREGALADSAAGMRPPPPPARLGRLFLPLALFLPPPPAPRSRPDVRLLLECLKRLIWNAACAAPSPTRWQWPTSAPVEDRCWCATISR